MCESQPLSLNRKVCCKKFRVASSFGKVTVLPLRPTHLRRFSAQGRLSKLAGPRADRRWLAFFQLFFYNYFDFKALNVFLIEKLLEGKFKISEFGFFHLNCFLPKVTLSAFRHAASPFPVTIAGSLPPYLRTF